MARVCLGPYGEWQHFPREGGVLEQVQFELDAIQAAHYARHEFADEKRRAKIPGSYLMWLDEDNDDKPEYTEPIYFCGGRWLETGYDTMPLSADDSGDLD